MKFDDGIVKDSQPVRKPDPVSRRMKPGGVALKPHHRGDVREVSPVTPTIQAHPTGVGMSVSFAAVSFSRVIIVIMHSLWIAKVLQQHYHQKKGMAGYFAIGSLGFQFSNFFDRQKEDVN